MTELHALVAYTPATHTDLVLKAIGDAGAGRIGNYSHCSFVSPGTGEIIRQLTIDPTRDYQPRQRKTPRS